MKYRKAIRERRIALQCRIGCDKPISQGSGTSEDKRQDESGRVRETKSFTSSMRRKEMEMRELISVSLTATFRN